MKLLSTKIEKILKSDRQQLFVSVFFLLILLLLLIRTVFIVDVNNFLSTYKYMTSDSYDWFANGLFYFSDIPNSFRNIGLPMIIRLLYELDLVWLLPFINSIFYWIFLVFLYKVIERVTKSSILGILFVVALLFSFELYEYSKYILADFYAVTFILISTYYLSKKRYKLGFLMLGFSALFQNFAFFLLPFWALAYFVESFDYKFDLKDVKNLLKRGIKVAAISLLFFFLPNIPVMIYKLIKFGNPIYSEVTQFELLSFHTSSTLYYLIGLIDLVTPVLILFGIVGLFGIFYQRDWKKFVYHLIGLFISLLFWVFIYDWVDKRFLLYSLPFILLLAGYGIYWSYQTLFKRYLRCEIYYGFVMAFVMLLIWVPSSNFFDSEVIHIIPTYAYELDYENRQYIEENSKYASYPVKDVLYNAPYWGDFLRYRDNIWSLNMYGLYTEQFDDTFDSEDKTLCIEKYPSYDFYTLRSVFRIYYGEDLEGEQIVTSNCR